MTYALLGRGWNMGWMAIWWVLSAALIAFVVWALLYDWFRNRIVHPVFAIGGPLLVVSWPLRAVIAHTDTWLAISGWLTS